MKLTTIRTLLEQVWNGEWHSESSLRAKGFKHDYLTFAMLHGFVEVRDDDDKHGDWYRITPAGRAALERKP